MILLCVLDFPKPGTRVQLCSWTV